MVTLTPKQVKLAARRWVALLSTALEATGVAYFLKESGYGTYLAGVLTVLMFQSAADTWAGFKLH